MNHELLVRPKPGKSLPPLRFTRSVYCEECGAKYAYGDTGRTVYYEFTDAEGAVHRYKPGPGSPCCRARALSTPTTNEKETTHGR